MSEKSELHFELERVNAGRPNRPFVAGNIPLIITGANEAV